MVCAPTVCTVMPTIPTMQGKDASGCLLGVAPSGGLSNGLSGVLKPSAVAVGAAAEKTIVATNDAYSHNSLTLKGMGQA